MDMLSDYSGFTDSPLNQPKRPKTKKGAASEAGKYVIAASQDAWCVEAWKLIYGASVEVAIRYIELFSTKHPAERQALGLIGNMHVNLILLNEGFGD